MQPGEKWLTRCDERAGTGYDKDAKAWTKAAPTPPDAPDAALPAPGDAPALSLEVEQVAAPPPDRDSDSEDAP